MRINWLHTALSVATLGAVLTACGPGEDDPGLEYAPQMYHSVPYEPLSQIKDEDAGDWLSSREDDRGEFYNTIPGRGMNMITPPEHTVSRNRVNLLPMRIPADSAGSTTNLELASATLKSPYDQDDERIIEDGRVLYSNFCYPCHGASGKGDGPVGQVYKGVANLAAGQVAQATEGHIFHVITYGKGRMFPHGSQIDPADRWKIVRYVQTLQQGGQN